MDDIKLQEPLLHYRLNEAGEIEIDTEGFGFPLFSEEQVRAAILADRQQHNADESDALTVAHMCGYEDGLATVKESVTVLPAQRRTADEILQQTGQMGMSDDLQDEIIRKLSAMNREQFKAHLESCGFDLVDYTQHGIEGPIKMGIDTMAKRAAFRLFKGPFYFHEGEETVYDANHNCIVRTTMRVDVNATVQDAIGELVADSLTDYWQRQNTQAVKESVQDERAAFEAWCVAHDLDINRYENAEYSYNDVYTDAAWEAWQARAARAPVADKLAEALRVLVYTLGENHDWSNWQTICIDPLDEQMIRAALAEWEQQRGGDHV